MSYSAIVKILQCFSLSCTVQYSRQDPPLYSQLPDLSIFSLSIFCVLTSIFHFFFHYHNQTPITCSMCSSLVLLPIHTALFLPLESSSAISSHADSRSKVWNTVWSSSPSIWFSYLRNPVLNQALTKQQELKGVLQKHCPLV